MWSVLLSALALASDLQPPDAADGLEVAFGKGVSLSSADRSFTLTLRGRVQLRTTAAFRDAPDPLDVGFEVRRARLLFTGELPAHHLLLYLQLGLGPSDIEAATPVPLRDWVVAWTRLPSFSLRMGQMKVPFSRERLMSSSALEFVDRTLVNAELNLDRDIGLQLYSNDLGGWDGRLAYQIGLYNGEGRNRPNVGDGLLYVGRLSLQPLGPFPDTLTQGDLVREGPPRLSFGVAGGVNDAATRARSTHGDPLAAPTDLAHGAADVLFKWEGISLQSEVLVRDALTGGEDAPPDLWGWMAQGGYVFPWFSEVGARWAELRPLDDPDVAVSAGPTFAVGHYVESHELKLQADVGWVDTVGLPREHEVRLQLQVFF